MTIVVSRRLKPRRNECPRCRHRVLYEKVDVAKRPQRVFRITTRDFITLHQHERPVARSPYARENTRRHQDRRRGRAFGRVHLRRNGDPDSTSAASGQQVEPVRPEGGLVVDGVDDPIDIAPQGRRTVVCRYISRHCRFARGHSRLSCATSSRLAAPPTARGRLTPPRLRRKRASSRPATVAKVTHSPKIPAPAAKPRGQD